MVFLLPILKNGHSISVHFIPFHSRTWNNRSIKEKQAFDDNSTYIFKAVSAKYLQYTVKLNTSDL